MTSELNSKYDPKAAQVWCLAFWNDRGYFHSDPERGRRQNKQPFTIVIPPPNVTGSLHWGHALNNTLQDILVRYKRMDGYETLWMPGTDHAGIAVHVILERQLAAEGTTKEGIGREAFLARAWKWKQESGGTIVTQLKRLGASCDWQRGHQFTM